MNNIAIQINIIQIYRLNSFPEQRINQLISELNVHYGKINGYIEANIDREVVDIELIESLSKLEEIYRLAPQRIQPNSMPGDFRLGIDLLDSIVALLSTRAGHSSTRGKFLKLGWNLLFKLYSYSYEQIKKEALLFNWLKQHDLARATEVARWGYRGHEQNSGKIKFSPSELEIEAFYEKNKQEIYRYMVYEMGPDKFPSDPFLQPDAADFYHYHQTLSNISAQAEA